ncbi:MAG: DUF6600 domain-containing protein [Verrucomicrobiota bacterium]
MKTRLIILAIGLAGSLGPGLFRASADFEVSAGVSIHATAQFYEPLASRGTWIEVGSYGRCWHPAGVAVGWRPYCDGYWEWTDCGWYWVSDEPWSWACYHYGTWVYDANVGWCWVPGVEWAPAWVNWRIGGDYIGWVPCGPPGVVIAPSFFVFVESRHFHDRVRPGNVIVNNTIIFNKTTQTIAVKRESRKFDGRTQTVMVNEGPRADVVEKATGKRFTATPVRDADRQTSVSIPEQVKHQTAGPANSQNPASVHKETIPAPQHNLTPGESPATPHYVPPNRETPPRQTIHPNKESPPDTGNRPPGEINPPRQPPPDTGNRPPKEINPPRQPQAVPPGPGKPPERDQGNGSHRDEKDQGHDKP